METDSAIDADPARPWRSERLVLRRLCSADLDRFAAYRADAELGRYQGWAPMAREASAAFIAEMAQAPAFVVGEWLQLAIADRAGDGLIGDVGVHLNDAATAEIGFTLAREWHGRGLGREAVQALIAMLFERTAVQRIIGITDARNTASARLMTAAGMRHAMTQDAVFRGEPCVEWTFEVLKPSHRAS
jgi:aminoglycoside 6'-N-acetyltransferase